MNVAVVIILWGLFVVGVTMLCGLIWMLGLGVLAHIFNNPHLAIGYWQSVVLALFVNMILGVVGARLRKDQ